MSCVDCSVKIADFGLSRVVEPDAVARDSPAGLDSMSGKGSNGKSSGGSDLSGVDDEESDVDQVDMDGDIQYIQSPLPDYVFRDQQSQMDHHQQSQRGTLPGSLPPVTAPLLGLIPGSVFNSPVSGGYPMVSKLPLKRALTKHVVSRPTIPCRMMR